MSKEVALKQVAGGVVCAVVVNYQTFDTVVDTICGLYYELKELPESKIVVVDNDSNDDSYERLLTFVHGKGWEHQITILNATRNGGFGAGNNFAVRYCSKVDYYPEYFLIINPDAIPEKGLVKTFTNFLNNNQEVGIVGGTIKRPTGETKVSGFTFPNIVSEFLNGFNLGILRRMLQNYLVADKVLKETCEVDWVSGACFMIRSDVFGQIGLFDESFFLYYEEIDLCRRAKNAGWKVVHSASRGIVHICGVATGIQDKKKRTPPYLFDSRKYYLLKHYGLFNLWVINCLFVLGCVLNRCRLLIQKKKVDLPPYHLIDFIKNSF